MRFILLPPTPNFVVEIPAPSGTEPMEERYGRGRANRLPFSHPRLGRGRDGACAERRKEGVTTWGGTRGARCVRGGGSVASATAGAGRKEREVGRR